MDGKEKMREKRDDGDLREMGWGCREVRDFEREKERGLGNG